MRKTLHGLMAFLIALPVFFFTALPQEQVVYASGLCLSTHAKHDGTYFNRSYDYKTTNPRAAYYASTTTAGYIAAKDIGDHIKYTDDYSMMTPADLVSKYGWSKSFWNLYVDANWKGSIQDAHTYKPYASDEMWQPYTVNGNKRFRSEDGTYFRYRRPVEVERARDEVDSTAPNFNINYASADWRNTGITVKVEPYDTGCGGGVDNWNYYKYRIHTGATPSGDWSSNITSKASRSITIDGVADGTAAERYLTVYLIDKSNNSRTVTKGPYKIDKKPPVANDISVSGYRYVSNNVYWVRPDDTISVTTSGTDTDSKLSRSYIRIYNSENDTRYGHDWNDAANSIFLVGDSFKGKYVTVTSGSVNSNGTDTKKYTFNVKFLPESSGKTLDLQSYFVDKAGNTSNNGNYTDSGKDVKVDGTPPSVVASISSREWENTDVSVTLTYFDAHSGVASKEYKWSTSSSTPTSWDPYLNAVKQTENGSWYLHYRVTDNVGYTKTGAFGPFNIDKNAPTVTFGTNGSSTYKNSHSTTVTVSDSGGSGLKSYEYAWTTSDTTLPTSWSNFTNGATISTPTSSGTHYLWVKATDNAGNEVITRSNGFMVDRTNPTFSAKPISGEWQNNPHQVTVSYTDKHSGVATQQYAWSTSTSAPTSWNTYTSGVLTQPGEGTYYLHYRIVDGAGNSFQGYVGPYRYDKTAPTFSATPSSGDWQTTPHSVSPTYVDNQSGVTIKQYAWSTSTSTPSSWSSYSSGNLTQPGTGTYYLHYKVVDEAGNETIGYVGPYRYETTKPTGTLSQNPTDWTNGNVTLSLTGISDSGGSGYYRTKLPDGSYVTTTSATYTATSNGTYNFVIYDKAGNSTTYTQNVSNIDKEKPSATLTQSPTNWTNGDVTLTLSSIVDNGGSGYYRTKLPDGTFVMTTTATYTVSTNGTYSFVVYDRAGNSTTKNITVSNIDKVAPNGTVTYSNTDLTNQNVTITVTATDSESGVKSIQLPNGTIVNGATASYTVSGNGIFQFIITDVAGNTKTVTATVSNIDKSPPTLTLFPSTTAWTNKSIVITAVATDNMEVSRIELPNGQLVYADRATFTVTDNGTYTFKAYDVVGNVTTKTITISNIDTVKPSVSITETNRTGTRIDVKLDYSD